MSYFCSFICRFNHFRVAHLLMLMVFFTISGSISASQSLKMDSLLKVRNQHEKDILNYISENKDIQEAHIRPLLDSLNKADNLIVLEIKQIDENLNMKIRNIESIQNQLANKENDIKVLYRFLNYLLFGLVLFVIMFFVLLTIYLVKKQKYAGLGGEIMKLKHYSEKYRLEVEKGKEEMAYLIEKNKTLSREMFSIEKSIQEQVKNDTSIVKAPDSEIIELRAMLSVLQARNQKMEELQARQSEVKVLPEEKSLVAALEKERLLHEHVREELLRLRQEYHDLKQKAGIE